MLILIIIISIGIIWILFDWFDKPHQSPSKTFEPKNYQSSKIKPYSYKQTKSRSSLKKKIYSESKTKANKDILLEAINANRNVSFRYVDKNDQETFREVTPRKVFWYEFGDEGKMECLDAYCLLRNESRTFALFRISNLNIK